MRLLTYLMNSFSIVVGSKSSISSSSSPDVKILNHLQRCCTCSANYTICTCNSLLDLVHVPNRQMRIAKQLVFWYPLVFLPSCPTKQHRVWWLPLQKQKCVKSSSVNVTRLVLGLFGSGLQDYHAVKHGTLKMAVQE